MKNPVAMRFAARVAIAACFAAFAPSSASAVTATKEYVDRRDEATLSAAQSAAQTAITAATNGLVTASVTNGLASAASVEQEAKDRAAAIAAERTARESAGYLTAESDPSFAAWMNGMSIVAGKGAFATNSANGVTIGCDATNRYGSVAIGPNAFCGAGVTIGGYANGVGVTIGDGANGAGVTIGGSANGTGGYNVVIGENAYNDYANAIVIGASGYDAKTTSQGTNTFNISTPSPAFFWFNSVNGSTARTLQSYLDERATTNDLAATDANVAANAAAISAVSDELGQKAKRYALVASASASIKAADGNLYSLTADTNGVAVTLPAALADYAQDFVLRVVAADTNGTQIAEISGVNVDLPNGDVFADGSLKGTNYVTFTQTTASPATWSIGYFAATKEEE